jgi:hypothetical protein
MQGKNEPSHTGNRYPLMSGKNIILFGHNQEAGWIDATETKHLEQCSMITYPASQVRGKAGE